MSGSGKDFASYPNCKSSPFNLIGTPWSEHHRWSDQLIINFCRYPSRRQNRIIANRSLGWSMQLLNLQTIHHDLNIFKPLHNYFSWLCVFYTRTKQLFTVFSVYLTRRKEVHNHFILFLGTSQFHMMRIKIKRVHFQSWQSAAIIFVMEAFEIVRLHTASCQKIWV